MFLTRLKKCRSSWIVEKLLSFLNYHIFFFFVMHGCVCSENVPIMLWGDSYTHWAPFLFAMSDLEFLLRIFASIWINMYSGSFSFSCQMLNKCALLIFYPSLFTNNERMKEYRPLKISCHRNRSDIRGYTLSTAACLWCFRSRLIFFSFGWYFLSRVYFCACVMSLQLPTNNCVWVCAPHKLNCGVRKENSIALHVILIRYRVYMCIKHVCCYISRLYSDVQIYDTMYI